MIDDHFVAAYDAAGRLYSIYRDDHTFRRGLGGFVLEKWKDHSSIMRRSVPPAEADALVERAAGEIRGVVEAIEDGRFAWEEQPESAALDEVRQRLAEAAAFDASRACADAAEFARIYRPLGILPPDQYLSVVVQATEGCSFNTCTFCDLYHDGYRVKTIDEFDRHVEAVYSFLGGSARLRRRGVFLGAANALAVPMARLRPMFERLAAREAVRGAGVCAFVDGFTGQKKSFADYEELRTLGLRRVYIGLESGNDALLEFVRKPGTSRDAVETARAVKAAGVRLGIIVMIGLGGARFGEAHVRDTIAALNDMRLDAQDLLYFSELVEVPGTSYPLVAQAENIRPLTSAERRAQEQAIRSGLTFAGPPPHMAVYDVREFVY